MARSRNKKTEIEEEIEKRIPTTRYNPDYKVGLTAQQVQEHRLHGWVNRAVDPPSKTTKEIVHENVFTYFNLIFLVLAILLCLVGSFRNLTFLPVIIANTLIGIIQEVRAKKVLDNLTMLNAPKATVVRDGKRSSIDAEELVVDDIVIFKAGAQVCADAQVCAGEVQVNESLLTGESDEITKHAGDQLMSGSFIISGQCHARLDKVGEDSYISKLTLEAKEMQNGEQSEMIRSLDKLVRLVCFNTNLAAAVATCVTMIFTWLRYGKPDVSMTLNGSLAGLVAITAGCDAVSPFGAFLIGFVAGILVVLSVEFFDKIAKIDDPVGAVSVHFANGVWGTIAVGLFSNGGDGVGKGLFYGGGFAQLGTQLLGLITVDVYVVVVMFIIFKIIDKTIGLRVPAEVEIDGLDIHEHGLTSAYAGFSISDANAAAMVPNENTDLGEDDASKASAVQMNAAVPVVKEPAVIHDGIYDTGMHKVSIIAKLSTFDQLKTALNDLGVTGMTVTQVMGCGIQKGTTEKYRGVPVDSTLLPKIKVEVIVSKISVDAVVDAAKKALYTGHIGDGKIFVYNVTRVVKIRTGEEDFAALQDVE